MEQVVADLAFDLRFYLAIVVVQVVVRGITDETNDQLRDCVQLGPALHRRKRLSVNGLVLT